jgi:stage III sporulation protein SpoIIIAA
VVIDEQPSKEQIQSTDELQALLAILPDRLQGAARALDHAELLEIVLDLGRPPEARLAGRAVRLADDPIGRADLRHALEQISPLSVDNRAGIERTLHRISAIRNRAGDVVGLTMRVGRALFGTIAVLRDLVESGRNILLLGRPGVGKTTKLRETARVLADELGRRVIVVDTSNEIGGDGDVPHPGIGSARRMQVSHPDRQHAVMIEAVENHMPEVIVIDEIGTIAEAAAARTIAERGVQLIGTAHGTSLENLIMNPTLSDLVGGIHTVTLSDEEARRRHTPKTITERRGPPTFDSLVELVDHNEAVVHWDTAQAVDQLLAGRPAAGQRRRVSDGGSIVSEPMPVAASALPALAAPRSASVNNGPLRLYAHSVSRELLARMISDLHIEARIVRSAEHADVILALRDRAHERDLREAATAGVRLMWLKRNSSTEIRRALRDAFALVGGAEESEVRDALAEAEHAVARAMSEAIPVSLAPRPPELRKVQHRVIARYHLETESVGREPFRHLVVHPVTSGERLERMQRMGPTGERTDEPH